MDQAPIKPAKHRAAATTHTWDRPGSPQRLPAQGLRCHMAGNSCRRGPSMDYRDAYAAPLESTNVGKGA